MNDIIKNHLEAILKNKKFLLKEVNEFIEQLQRTVAERKDEANELVEEIKALEKHLNK